MGIFASYARKYWESGYSVVPLGGKKNPIPKGWQRGCAEKPSLEDMEFLEREYPGAGIGVCTGAASDVIGFDFDLESEDTKRMEKIILDFLPPTPCVKVGRKGWTRFYRYSERFKKSQSWSKDNMTMVDLLSDKKQTVLPPSIHPKTKKPYIWTGVDLLSVKSTDLPFLPDNLIEFMNSIATPKVSRKDRKKLSPGEVRIGDGGRHLDMLEYAWGIIEKTPNIDELVKKLIEYDTKENATKQYLIDKDYFLGKSQLEAALEVAKKAEITVRNAKSERGVVDNWKIGDEKTEDEKLYTEWKVFFENTREFKLRKELLSNQLVMTFRGKDMPAMNNIGAIKTFGYEMGLSGSKLHDYLNRYSLEIEPQLFLPNIEWDGEDRIKQLFDFVTMNNFTKDQACEIMKGFCSKIFARLENSRVQNKMVIFEGPQGVGKDTFIQNIFDGFGQYFCNSMVREKEEDNYYVMESSLVINISEFDRAAKRSVASLKNIVTSDSARLRAAFDRDVSVKRFCCSFVSSCNLKDVLRDSTGNRRFIFFEIKDIDWNYPKFSAQEKLQIVAQCRHLFRSGFKVSQEVEAMLNADIQERTPIDPLDLALLHYDVSVHNALNGQMKRDFLNFSDVEMYINDASKASGVGNRTILSALKRTKRCFLDQKNANKGEKSRKYVSFYQKNDENVQINDDFDDKNIVFMSPFVRNYAPNVSKTPENPDDRDANKLSEFKKDQ